MVNHMRLQRFPFLLLVVVGLGCQDRSEFSQIKSGLKNSVQTKPKPQSETRQLLHDFGVVEPSSKHSYLFEIHNDTREQWKVEKIASSCSCSVARATSDLILPGKSEQFEFLYSASSKATSDKKTVVVYFKSATTRPTVELTVTARVRDSMFISPDHVDFGTLSIGENNRRRIDIYNYSKTKWKDIVVPVHPNWLEISLQDVTEKKINKDEPDALQHFVLNAKANTAHLTSDQKYQSLIQIHDSDLSIKQSLFLECKLEADVSVLPDVIMLGAIKPGDENIKRVDFIFRKPVVFEPENVTVKYSDTLHNVASGKFKTTKDGSWQYEICLNIGSETIKPGILKGYIEFVFTNMTPATLKVPLFANIVPRGKN